MIGRLLALAGGRGPDPIAEAFAASAGGGLSVRGVSRSFDGARVVDDVTFELREGEFATLLGPSGCGKTTLLRMVAGFEPVERGGISLGGLALDPLPPERRPVNLVFQNYALFPHLSVRENVAFGPRSRRVPAREVAERVAEAVAMLRLEGLEERRPHEISGGQRQRVALARAVANRPRLLLLDEPMSALDARLRADVQLELRRLQRSLGATFLLVTHDQDEAMTMSDRILVMNRGRIERQGSPREVYDRPGTRFVADFLGRANRIEVLACEGGLARTRWGELRFEPDGGPPPVALAIHPERIEIVSDVGGRDDSGLVDPGDERLDGAGEAPRGTVIERVDRGDRVELLVRVHAEGEVAGRAGPEAPAARGSARPPLELDDPDVLRVKTAPHVAHAPGDRVRLLLRPDRLAPLR